LTRPRLGRNVRAVIDRDKKKIHFVSLGCPKNRVDTEVMLGVSDGEGYELVADHRKRT